MYYNPGSVLFIRVPRTASAAIRNGLGEKYGPSKSRPFGGLNKHAFGRELQTRLSTEAYQSCERFMVVRNPWERLVSLYRWLHQHGITKASFCQWLLSEPEHPYLNKSLLQSTWHADGVEIFHYEELSNLIRHFGISLEAANASGRYRWREYYSPKTKDFVYRIHKPDITAFGFEF